ncbi:hypothetical protein E2C01_053086 [Portunus trituberculatus]|uniref:Uncharacterized protein n=1 Tax=Portunus trituberculatus TaxID=210409 RepID=A0A5B7GG60_PORTR|nr:hypothetical protein [Portunus trituberculatus]
MDLKSDWCVPKSSIRKGTVSTDTSDLLTSTVFMVQLTTFAILVKDKRRARLDDKANTSFDLTREIHLCKSHFGEEQPMITTLTTVHSHAPGRKAWSQVEVSTSRHQALRHQQARQCCTFPFHAPHSPQIQYLPPNSSGVEARRSRRRVVKSVSPPPSSSHTYTFTGHRTRLPLSVSPSGTQHYIWTHDEL